ncbi:hypothetical protein MPSEU_000197900 [Mayamaea pseudoterrestris]|nr:hypothetical protein MPSEU_000197900 [Mayamaea pseudoterrestris]
MSSPLTLLDRSAALDPLAHLVEVASAMARLPQDSTPPRQTVSRGSGPQTVTTHQQESDYFSVVSNDEDESHKRSPASSIQCYSKREIFPQRLFAILNDPALTDVVSWLPHGRSFVIIRPDVFTDQVLPKYLPPTDARGSTKYASFTRKLNRWGFRQATRGPDTGAFSHPLFQKDKPELCHGMVCQRSRDMSSPEKVVKKTRKLTLSAEKSRCPVAKVAQPSPSKTPATVVAPSALAAAVAAVPIAPLLAPLVTSPAAASSPAATMTCTMTIPPGITNNQALIQAVLRQRDDMERVRAAKAMLYDAYMQALQSHEGEEVQS